MSRHRKEISPVIETLDPSPMVTVFNDITALRAEHEALQILDEFSQERGLEERLDEQSAYIANLRQALAKVRK